jgi:hypothetical protein
MRIAGITAIVSALLLFGCSNAPQQSAQQPIKKYKPLSKELGPDGLPKDFVSVPELKDVMDAMIMEQADVLWKVSGPEDAPKDDDGWHKIDHAAIAMIETAKFLQTGYLAKDQDEWLKRTNVLIDAANQARQSIKEKNADKLFEAGGAVEDACATCHKMYYVEG